MSALPETLSSRALGDTGLSISSIGWGMWRLVEAGLASGEIDALINGVLDTGITLFDTADIYGFKGIDGFGDAEILLGAALSTNPALRSRMVLATKGGIRPPLPYDQSASYLADAIDASLKRLKTDVIDLWQVHRPDILTHPQELARALENAVSAGKVRALGVSNFTIPQIDALQHFLGQKLVSTQPEVSALRLDCFENGEMDHAMMQGLCVLAWSPLGGGRIAKPVSPREQAVADALDSFAQGQDISRTTAALSWLMAHPAGIVPIVGSQNPFRIAEAAGAAKVRWTRQAWYAVYVAARGVPLP